MSLVKYLRGFLNLNAQTRSIRHITTTRWLTSDESSNERVITEGETKLINMLRERFPKAKQVDVIDISGGCGSMYAVYVETSEFKNMRTVKQHQLVNEVLKKEIKNNMHGLRIQTAVADD